jgi:myo-inositol-1(or 4)-monophosphatase
MQDILECATKAARAAGTRAVENFGKVFAREKTLNNLVTQTDLECESLIASMIRADFPNHAILAEEGSASADPLSDKIWIIDPLDGTNNYAHGIPHFSVSIAYAEQGDVLAGVVYDPMRDELFSAANGGGTFLNGKKIFVSSTPLLSQSIITTGFYYDRGELMEKTLDTIKMLFKADIRGIRRVGSAALDLSWVACGRFDGYFEYQLSPWDFAAGMLIVRESGGMCDTRAGVSLKLTSKSVAVSNGKIHDDFLKIVKWEE